ncbi:CDP-alcohol phosphatidyltransferase family protein [Clostridium luticellarii]|uniref:CDP-diacylglycerol--glycerol-3-phosphate 3-phosphatidyltransferase n=1 Tax=Clostridium luticellarii TaxID=1691940 RepID=A0A2T0BK37_9CLOT|nr:CDP-alcohol phosphatidyltransferase family protein [Clostridium luticellarii]MCI1946263.1 CDP-alcohol phosphatidyltransferase family protein [Clostridium luticellarii]MCI1969444.1 CDP-alcohol phosphatidyltransferase family protein [Clostridium luticellarii]MCI1996608.1 CDP-alcohol phosphatidyltransferase family protein [Clostridium luticellarii]MCI2039612.1 CDP-alcohol phosphatidyltransferase family protein [Clostridium luticellarii]PRR84217.1 CDP-diacylglycerol--glycerol-3-phosphate 3-phos
MQKIIKLIPNGITGGRIIMSILFVSNILEQFKYGHQKTLSLIVMFLCICISDFIDGYIARKFNCTSAEGARFDILADLFFLVSSYITLVALRILPLWFLIFICLKFVEFLCTSNFIKRHDRLSIHPFIFDRLGRIVAVMFFIVPGAACIFNVFTYGNSENGVNLLLYIILLFGLLSSYFRIRNCFKLLSD